MAAGCLSRKVPKILQNHTVHVHSNQDDVNHVREVMSFLIQTKSPPEDRILWLPPLIICEHALKTVNQAVHDKIQRTKPP